jgi:hypothetical protein
MTMLPMLSSAILQFQNGGKKTNNIEADQIFRIGTRLYMNYLSQLLKLTQFLVNFDVMNWAKFEHVSISAFTFLFLFFILK